MFKKLKRFFRKTIFHPNEAYYKELGKIWHKGYNCATKQMGGKLSYDEKTRIFDIIQTEFLHYKEIEESKLSKKLKQEIQIGIISNFENLIKLYDNRLTKRFKRKIVLQAIHNLPTYTGMRVVELLGINANDMNFKL